MGLDGDHEESGDDPPGASTTANALGDGMFAGSLARVSHNSSTHRWSAPLPARSEHLVPSLNGVVPPYQFFLIKTNRGLYFRDFPAPVKVSLLRRVDSKGGV